MTTTQLPDDLAALLAAHGIAPTTDALLDAITCHMWFVSLTAPSRDGEQWQVVLEDLHPKKSSKTLRTVKYGTWRVTALARAYQAMVKEER